MMIGKEEIIRTLDALANWQGSLSLTDKERVAIVTAMEAVKRQDKDVVPTEFHEKCMSKQLRRVAELEKQLKKLERPHGEWIDKHILMERLQEATAKSTRTEFSMGLLEAQRIVMNMKEGDEK